MQKLYLNGEELVIGGLSVHPSSREDDTRKVRIGATIRNMTDYESAKKLSEAKNGDVITAVSKNMMLEFKKTFKLTDIESLEFEISPDTFCDSVARIFFTCPICEESDEAKETC